ncbi:MAG: hypothetical protein MMC23_006403 [Stictis urceolatum]|nr:hypothetical protein [Stictis urceolata]
MSSIPSISNRSKIRRFGPNAPSYRGQLGGPNELKTKTQCSAGVPSAEERNAKLPQSIQFSLLQVGMRVRKAVSNGYPNTKLQNEESDTFALSNTPRGSPDMREYLNSKIQIYEDIKMKEAETMPPPLSPPKNKRTREDLAYEEIDGMHVLGDWGRAAKHCTEKLNRKIVLPKSRKIKSASGSGPPVVSPMEVDEDFGEAAFLVYKQ